MDWSRTPLGPMENWPDSLRVAVNLCLACRFPMHVWWGPELINIYNDGHVPVLGKRHPAALGQPAPVVWEEVWPLLTPQVEAVMRRGESTWNERAHVVLERNGSPEDAWFTWSYSPIRDERDSICGLMCIATEDTARILAERERDQLEEQRRRQEADQLAFATAELQENIALLKGISDSTGDAIFAKDREGRLRFANPATLALIGKPMEQVLGKTDADLLDDVDAARKVMENDRRIMESGVSEDIEEIVPFPDGTRRIWLSRKMPNLNAEGRVVGLLGVSRDITVQKQAEESRAKLAAIVESSGDAIISKTLGGIITTWNGGAERIFGYTADEVVGRHISLLIPPDRLHEEASIQERLRRGERMDHFETVRIARDGRTIDVSLTVSPVRNSDGKVVGASKIVRDITARKRVEAKLEESQIRTQFAMEIMGAGEWELNLDDHTAHRSLQHDRIFGYESLVPSWTYEMFLEHVLPEDRDAVDRAFREATKSRQTWDFECRIVRRDQAVRWIKAAGRHFDLGNSGRVVGVVQDISERKKAEESLTRQAEELARSNIELERFAYVASHDLQEPMKTIQRFAELLRRNMGQSLKGDAQEFLDFIVGGVQRMQNLINDLLAYSRVSSQGANFAPADCKAICNNVLENLQASIESNHASVTIEPLPVVIGDATQLGQVFQNLLINAIKFHGERTPRIHVSVSEAPREWVFSIRDNGIGIAPEYFERIFIIFQRLHTIEEYGGTGIGLAICKKIAERHGGRIWVESVPGEGSTFCFSILKREKATCPTTT